METTFLKTSPLVKKDRDCIWHPFTQMHTARLPIPIVSAKGAYLYAEDGSRYLDAISSWWVNLHGHTHPYIVQKIQSQVEVLEHVIFADFTHTPAIELASRLLSILPGSMSKIFYSDNGSTSVEVALKIALQYWHNRNTPKTKVICFKNSFHGETFGAMSVAGKNEFNKPFWKHLFDVESIDPPLKGQEDQSFAQLQSLLDQDDVACFIFEPLVLGSGGMIMYPSDGLSHLIQHCRQHHVLTIADEVMTGFGRTGTLFASEQVSEKPDLICLSKGLTGGFLPLGVTACTNDIYHAFLGKHLHQAFLHGHSYTANPLACSSALASLDLLLQDTCNLQREMIAECHKEFCRQWQLHPKLKRCETLGTILALEYQTEKSSYFQPIRDRLYHFFLNKGILLRPLGNVLYILPPYCIKADELKFIYNHIIFTLEGNL
ncbi:MAG: adenosylmethionine--8-amino-7-oxononanoate transaminase [Chlamydiales bacterium]|jgi:adenosylmethionine-8-amino-7-oxononanoate aminotransferase|nr:adenosylmethionine--8-amino-7-oxononanoate transaminase [Chlamydiales bacterium]